MNTLIQRDPVGKSLLRTCWRSALLAHTLFASSRADASVVPRVFYGGARSGNVGGPLVKVKRLQESFPQHVWNYNLAYVLSNAPYLPAAALNWLRFRGTPIVLNQNGVFYPGWYAGNWKRQNEVMAQAYHRADYVFWQSEFCRRAADQFLGKRVGKGEILFNAIDMELFAPTERGVDRPFTFLLTGKIGRHLGYRLESTINGLAKARNAGLDAKLKIAGWVEDISFVRSLVERHGLSNHIVMTGPYTQEQAPSIYLGGDAYVMTKYLDPCPNTVIEAMACGLPVLYSASGGVPELVGDESGIGLPVPEEWNTVHVPSAETIAEGMLKIAASREVMSQAARERAVRNFDIRNWIERHRAVFTELLEMRQ
jgi:glycosyltransferase involved in cell wall biosynthesis